MRHGGDRFAGVVLALLAGAGPAGRHPLHWDLRDDAGVPVSSDIFLVRLEAGDIVFTRRMIAIR